MVKPDGMRRYRWLYFSVARKNAKSTLAAALALYHLFNDHEPNPRIYLAAVNLDQTRETFEIIELMLEAVPKLNQSSTIRSSDKRKEVIRFKDGKRWGYIQALTRGGAGKEGKNPSVVIFDELHQWGEPDAALWAAMTTGSKARKQPLFIITTTAGRHAEGLCYERYEYAKKVQSGAVDDPTFLPAIWEANEKEWQQEAAWIKANPLVAEGFIPVESVHAEYLAARSDARALAEFKRTNLNVWAGHFDAFLDIARWKDQTETIHDENLIGLPCIGAFDLSRTTDFTALVLLFVETLLDQRRKYYVKPHFFLPGEGIHERSVKDGQPYELWAEKGLLTLSEGANVDYQQVFDRLKELSTIYRIQEVAYDPYNAAFLVQALQNAGFQLSPFRQGSLSMNAPLKELQKVVNERLMVHGNHPILTWEAGQFVVKEDEAGNVKPSKKSRKRKIDGMVSVTMALGTAMHIKQFRRPLSWDLMPSQAADLGTRDK
jgi:phage terminase large subunit-like protein